MKFVMMELVFFKDEILIALIFDKAYFIIIVIFLQYIFHKKGKVS